MTRVFTLTLAATTTSYIGQAGTRSFNVDLDDEQAAGILLMARNVFGSDYPNKLLIQPAEPLSVGQAVYMAEEYDSDHLIVVARTIIPLNYGELWSSYIQRLAAHSRTVDQLPLMDVDALSAPYTCRLLNVDRNWSFIFQFSTPSFLQGAITTCQWFNLDPITSYLDNVHEGDALINV